MTSKKIIALLLCMVFALSCTACTTEIIIELGEIPTGSAPAPAPAPSPEPSPAPTPDSGVAETPTESTPDVATTAAPGGNTEEPSSAAPAPSTGAPQTKAEILSYYNTAANNIKTKATSVTRNYEDYQHNADKLELPSLLKSAGESLIGSFLKKNETPEVYQGADAVKNFYLPGESYVSKLTEAQIKSAECKDNGSEYEITIVANTEKNPTYGQGISGGFEIIKTDDVMDAAGFIVKSFDTEYYDCTIKCKVDKATGNITWINFATPIVMNVASSIGINATVGMTFIKDYTVSY